MATDAERLDWLEIQAMKSPTGVSFDWVPACEGERSGWRYMHRHFISDQKPSFRDAIDHAMATIQVRESHANKT